MADVTRASWIAAALALAIGGAIFAAAIGHSSSALENHLPERRGEGTSDGPSAMSENAQARIAFASGMLSIHDATREAALASFAEATTRDPTFAAAHLRYVVTARVADDDVREHARLAVAERRRLNAHDRTLLDAYLPWTLVPQDVAASERILDKALDASGDDADYAYHLCRMRTFLGNFAGAAEACARAARIDPTFADALHFQGFALLSLNDIPAARDVYARCLAISPAATSCLRDLAELEMSARRCDEVVLLARRLIALDPNTAIWFRLLAFGLYGTNDSMESVRIAYEQSWARRPAARRGIYEAAESAQMAIATGRFDEAEIQLKRYGDAIATSTDAAAHLEQADFLADLYIEQGRFGDALRVADAYDRKRAAWGALPYGDTSIYVARWRYQSHALSRPQLAKARDAWLDGECARPSASGQFGNVNGTRWTLAYAMPTMTKEDAQEALLALPEYLPLSATFGTQEEHAIGRTYWLGGKVEDAIAHLSNAASTCVALVSPFESPRAAYELGLAFEGAGRKSDACNAYASVVSRWPRTSGARTSIAATAARSRLQCNEPIRNYSAPN